MSANDDRQRLREINDTLAAGVTETSVDGETAKFDLKHLRRQKAEIEVRLGIRRRRPRMFGLHTGDG